MTDIPSQRWDAAKELIFWVISYKYLYVLFFHLKSYIFITVDRMLGCFDYLD